MTNSYLRTWSTLLKQSGFRWDLIVTVVALVAVLSGLANFLQMIELRPGVVFDDPLLRLFSPRDLTWLTFAVIYIGLLAGVVLLSREPGLLLIALQSYIVMVVIRMIAMSLVPLDPPPTMIPLADPTVEYFGTGTLLTKDLFFSGHTSTLFLLFLVTHVRWQKVVFITCVAVVAACVLIQHVHYSIDVYAAPFFAYGAYRSVILGRRQLTRRLYGEST
ncbi:MAG: hypothetical protein KAJ12_11150 [Bacteroidetes bacterium]|nr:hypothetical protein [Bacteroidota bacterium]